MKSLTMGQTSPQRYGLRLKTNSTGFEPWWRSVQGTILDLISVFVSSFDHFS